MNILGNIMLMELTKNETNLNEVRRKIWERQERVYNCSVFLPKQKKRNRIALFFRSLKVGTGLQSYNGVLSETERE